MQHQLLVISSPIHLQVYCRMVTCCACYLNWHVFAHRYGTVTTGKYYLVDSGYPNRVGYLAPYKGTKYHMQEYRNVGPQGKEEIFNYTHSSLRNVVERAFGVMKMKWRMLRDVPPYSTVKQSMIICSCMALHNFMRTSGVHDRHFEQLNRDANYVPPEAFEFQPDPEVVEDEWNVMNQFRDSIATALCTGV
jgi:hypothetical protein